MVPVCTCSRGRSALHWRRFHADGRVGSALTSGRSHTYGWHRFHAYGRFRTYSRAGATLTVGTGFTLTIGVGSALAVGVGSRLRSGSVSALVVGVGYAYGRGRFRTYRRSWCHCRHNCNCGLIFPLIICITLFCQNRQNKHRTQPFLLK